MPGELLVWNGLWGYGARDVERRVLWEHVQLYLDASYPKQMPVAEYHQKAIQQQLRSCRRDTIL